MFLPCVYWEYFLVFYQLAYNTLLTSKTSSFSNYKSSIIRETCPALTGIIYNSIVIYVLSLDFYISFVLYCFSSRFELLPATFNKAKSIVVSLNSLSFISISNTTISPATSGFVYLFITTVVMSFVGSSGHSVTLDALSGSQSNVRRDLWVSLPRGDPEDKLTFSESSFEELSEYAYKYEGMYTLVYINGQK